MLRLTPIQYRNSIQDIFDGLVPASTAFPPQTTPPSVAATSGFTTDPDYNGVDSVAAESLMNAAEETADAVASALPSLLPCSATAADDACVTEFITKYGRRTFRRAPLAEEVAPLMAVYHDMRTSGGDFSDGVAAVATSLLLSPQFLYLPIAGTESGPNVLVLTDAEVATRLSYSYWDSPPDEALLVAAEAGELRTQAQIEAQVRRLITSDRARPTLVRFFREWTRTTAIGANGRDPARYPEFDDALAAAMQEAFDRFVLAMVRDGHSLRDLLTSTEAFVNARLAKFYGLPLATAGSDADWAQVSLDPTRYAGLTTQPAMLTSLSHYTEPSYVFRGVFLRTRLVCQDLGPPPANAQSVFEMVAAPDHPTARQKSEAVRARPEGCGNCHNLIDPPGLAFDAFDAIGQYRTVDVFGNPIVTSDKVAFGTSTLNFATAPELMKEIADTGLCEPCFARQWLRFTFGRRGGTVDDAAVKALADKLQGPNGSLQEMMVALATDHGFLYRQTTEAP